MNIKQGMTFGGWTPYVGFLLLAFGIVMVVFSLLEDPIMFLPAIVLSFFGVVIFMDLRGTSIDTKNDRCRMYRDLILFKVGHWVSLSHFDHVAVTRYREQFGHSIGSALGRTAHIRTYFVSLRGERISILLKECDTRKEAVRWGQKVSAFVNMPLDDLSAPPSPRPDRRR